ncbi:MAG: hypothetical protein JNL87_06900 [Burkholderiaceae bacterium]|nr:hypothetical protein [Burkholderiaceae bacterium]
MNPFRVLHRLTRRLPADERAQRMHAALLPLRASPGAPDAARVTVQCVQDSHYLALFTHLIHALRQRTALRVELFVPRSFDAAIGTGWKLSLLRAFPLGRLQSDQWVRLYEVLSKRVGYRSSSLDHPLGDLVDAWRSWRLWRRLESADALEAVVIDGVPCGDLVIDSYLRFRPSPRVNLDDPFLALVLWQAHRDVRRARRYFRRARPVLYLTSYTTYVQHGVAARVALQEGVRVFSFGNFQEFGKRLSTDDSYHTRNTLHYRRDFEQLGDPAPLLQEARRQLETRLSGGIDTATAYMAASAYRETTQKVPDARGAVVIFLHDFYDSPHVYADLVFPDFWEWICFTVETLRAAGIRFLVKPHPNQIALSDRVIDELKQRFPELELISPAVTNRQLVDAGMACAVTVYGTVAHEMAYLGVPAIACARHPHIAFDFCRTARSRAEYAELLRCATTEQAYDREAMRSQVLQFYVMHNLGSPAPERELRDALIASWMKCHDDDAPPAAIVQAFETMASLGGFETFVGRLLRDPPLQRVCQ